MIYYGVFIASDPTVNDEDRDNTEARLHLLVEGESLAEAERAFIWKIGQLWDTCAIEPRLTQIHAVELAEIRRPPSGPVCVYFSIDGSPDGMPAQAIIGESDVDRYEPELGEDDALPLFLDRLLDVPPVKWILME